MQNVLGIGLAAGKGMRLRPLTLKSSGYIRSKAAVRFLGERIINLIMATLQDQGLNDFLMITQGKENRGQVKSIIRYGEHMGMNVNYSPVELEHDDTGSGSAIIANLAHNPPSQDTLFVFPTDSLLEFDLSAMLAHHKRTGAAITIAACPQPADVIAGQYGMIDADADGRVSGFIEKPSLEMIDAHVSGSPHLTHSSLPTNAGFYLMDAQTLLEVRKHPAMSHSMYKTLDIGGGLLPWMVEHGYRIQAFPVERMGDIGNIPSYLQTMSDVLRGRFPSVMPFFDRHVDAPENMIIDPTSWEMADPISGLSLRNKVARGLVKLRGPLRIGKYVRIDPGVTIARSNIDDECLIQAGAIILNSSIGEGSLIGPYSQLKDTVVGMMVTIDSSRSQPVTLSGHAAIGDEVTLHQGVTLRNSVKIFPRLNIPKGVRIDSPIELASTDQLPISLPLNRITACIGDAAMPGINFPVEPVPQAMIGCR